MKLSSLIRFGLAASILVVAVPSLAQPVQEEEGQTQAQVVRAYGLVEALVSAYRANPDLQAARAQLRAVDELYPQALSKVRPSVSAVADYTSTNVDDGVGAGAGDSDPKTISVEVTQSLFRGFRTVAEMKQAENVIKAQRALLHQTEQNILQDVVRAYMGVLRDKEIVELSINNENVLSNHLKASRERLELGDRTKTDVSQAESRLAAARANRVRAEGNYRQSRAFFERTVGVSPDGLQKPDLNFKLPADREQAIVRSEANNPSVAFAAYSSEAAGQAIRGARGELLPSIDVSGGVGRVYDPSFSTQDEQDTSTVGIRATMPLYTGGGSYSRIRQAKQIQNQRRMEITSSRREAREQAVAAWEDLAAANAENDSRNAQIEAARMALEGVKIEAQYGSRTTLDVLDAEQEYLDALVAAVSAEHDRVVASFGLLAAMGEMTAQSMGLPVEVYDPAVNYQNVKNKWFGAQIQDDSARN